MKRGSCCVEKAVLVTVYVEKPLRRRIPSNQNHKHHHRTPLLHHPITQTTLNPTPRRVRGGGKGYDRKAELLRYSHGLRQSARSAPPTRMHPPASHHHQPSTKIVAVEVKRRPSRGPTCFGSLLPKIINGSHGNKDRKNKMRRNGSTTSMMTSMLKNIQVQKKQGFFSKLVSKLRKR